MSVNQWKLLKKFINKPGRDRGARASLSKAWNTFFHKLSSVRAPEINRGKNQPPGRSDSDADSDKYGKNKPALEGDKTQLPQQSQQSSLSVKGEKESKYAPLPDGQSQENAAQMAKKSARQLVGKVLQQQSRSDVEEKTQPKEVLGYFPQVLSGLKQKITKKTVPEVPDKVKQKLKQKKELESKSAIISMTRRALLSVATAENASSQLKRLEHLTTHLHKYPEARYVAVKEGAIRLLLKLRKHNKNLEIRAVLREALTHLGYVEPPPGNGIRILAIDGGGMRGLIIMEMLKKLEMLTGKRYYELFDFICGVSTGALMISVIAGHKKNLDEVARMYKELSKKIFNQSAFWGTSSLVWSHSYYSTEMWEELLKTNIGEMDMIKTARDPDIPKIAAVSAVMNQERVMAFVFRNYTLPFRVQSQYMGSNVYKLWQAARASAAAPSYFEEFRLGEFLHQDGGIMTNNPTAVAIHEAKHLWPGSTLQCVLSLGTGRTRPRAVSTGVKAKGASSWRTTFLKILDSATDREAVHTILNDLLPNNVYYRFNPFLTEMVPMDETRPEKISQLERDVEMFYLRNEDIFQEVAKALTRRAGFTQRVKNWINLQREIGKFK